MKSGYSMKHIGVSILVTLVVLVLASPFLRPSGRPGVSKTTAPVTCADTPELMKLRAEYHREMDRIAQQAKFQYEAGVISLADAMQARLPADLAYLETLPHSDCTAPVTRAVVKAFYYVEIEKLLRAMPEGSDAVIEPCYRARIDLLCWMEQVENNQAFMTAKSEWEKNPSPENLKKMFEAESGR